MTEERLTLFPSNHWKPLFSRERVPQYCCNIQPTRKWMMSCTVVVNWS